MQKLSDQTINKLADTFSSCAIKYFNASADERYESTSVSNYNVEKPHQNFYECLIKIINYFLGYEDLDLQDDDEINAIDEQLNDLKRYLENHPLNSEEVRRAFVLLDIEGFKNVNFPLDLITPDGVSLLLINIVSFLTEKMDQVTLFDPNIGTGNLAFMASNYLKSEVNLVGIENHELLARVVETKANLLQTNLDIYHDDALSMLPNDIDIIISDIATYDYENEQYHSSLYDQGVRYFPYLLIEHLFKLEKKVKMVFLIDNDFFSQQGNTLFKSIIDEYGTIQCLITLPINFFANEANAKSIIVISNDKNNVKNTTEIIPFPKQITKDTMMMMYNQIKECLK